MIAKKNSAQHEPTQTNESKDKPKNKREGCLIDKIIMSR